MRIGFIGLGMMGSRMVANLQKTGQHELVVYDVRREAGEAALAAGARWAETPADAARQSELVMTSLPGPGEVEAVAVGPHGIGDGGNPGLIWVDLSTSSPTLIRRLHGVLGERGIRVVDAPVSGGIAGAQDATLQIMVGCEPELFEQLKPVLAGIGDKIGYMGLIGAGEIAKLVHNQIALVVQQVVAEALSMGVKAGVEPERLLEAIRGGAYGRSGGGVGQAIERTVFTKAWERPTFALALARKDLGLATDLGNEMGVPMPLANVAEQALVECLNRGLGGQDMYAVWALQEDRANVEVRGTQRVSAS